MRFFTILMLFTVLALSKTEIADTQDGSREIYYQLGNGFVANEDNDSWHLAFKNGFIAGTIRANKNVTVYESLKLAIEDFGDPLEESNVKNKNNFNKVFNRNDDWKMGAFNIGGLPEEDFNFGWGEYFQGDGIYGSKLFVIEITEGQTKTLKQFAINSMAAGAYNISICNLDGTDLQDFEIKKADSDGKLFGYFNVLDGTLLDLQPKSNQWDFVFKEYTQLIPNGENPLPYGVIGLLTNNNIRVAKQNKNLSEIPKDSDYSFDINHIGYDWKTIKPDFSGYDIEPLSYFIQNTFENSEGEIIGDGSIYKLEFISYEGLGKDIIEFEINALATSVNIDTYNFGVYPNITKANSTVKLIHNLKGNAQASLYNLMGEEQFTSTINGNGDLIEHSLNIPNLPQGIYLLNIEVAGSNKTLKLIIE